MTLDVSNDWALRNWLLGFGGSVRVLSPQPLADAILEEFTRGCAVYQTRT
jgi:predicted DNA-binding transcriptional regulator YafY